VECFWECFTEGLRDCVVEGLSDDLSCWARPVDTVIYHTETAAQARLMWDCS